MVRATEPSVCTLLRGAMEPASGYQMPDRANTISLHPAGRMI